MYPTTFGGVGTPSGQRKDHVRKSPYQSLELKHITPKQANSLPEFDHVIRQMVNIKIVTSLPLRELGQVGSILWWWFCCMWLHTAYETTEPLDHINLPPRLD